MNKMKKLIPALCLLLVSATLLGTSTYAWFSMNTTVSVSSMQIKATASKNLLISGSNSDGSDKGEYKASLALTTKNESLVPVSTANTTTPTFFKLKDTGSKMEADSAEYKDDTTFAAATANDYVKETMYVKSTGQDATNLKAKVSFTGGTEALDPAIRIMFVVGSNAYVYAPVAGYTAGYKAIASLDESGKPVLTSTNVTISNNDTAILSSLTADQAVKIEVYIWYEGQDASCKSTNAVTLDNTVFTVEYSVNG